MTMSRPKVQAEEPVGIVISRGSRVEAAPKFWAYVWGPVPVDVEISVVRAAYVTRAGCGRRDDVDDEAAPPANRPGAPPFHSV